MNARLERKLRMFTVIIMAGTIAGFAVSFALGRTSPTSTAVGVVYGLLISATIGGLELFVLDGPMRAWLGNLSFTANLIARSAIYASIIVIIQLLQLGEVIAGVPHQTSSGNFWFGFIYSALLS
ncbi:MAG: adenylate cyclase, partial [Bradyrhizobium sp.]|nr:adenylate cyclase [Bradyrhizobium sp.]